MTIASQPRTTRLAGSLIGMLLVVGCGGGSTDGTELRWNGSADNSANKADRMAAIEMTQPGYPAGPSASPQAESSVDQAVRDLGLVDPDRGVRIATASGETGLLSLDQFRMAMLDRNASVRLAALEGLDLPCDATRMPYLREALNDSVAAVREVAVERLSTCPDPRAITLLLEARGDDNPRVREEVREALYRLTERADAGA